MSSRIDKSLEGEKPHITKDLMDKIVGEKKCISGY